MIQEKGYYVLKRKKVVKFLWSLPIFRPVFDVTWFLNNGLKRSQFDDTGLRSPQRPKFLSKQDSSLLVHFARVSKLSVTSSSQSVQGPTKNKVRKRRSIQSILSN